MVGHGQVMEAGKSSAARADIDQTRPVLDAKGLYPNLQI
jgi:hypothetical protein